MYDVKHAKQSASASSSAAPVASPGTEPEFFSHQITEARRFFLQLHPPWNEGIVVIGGGNEHCTADYHIARADFPYYSVEFVARGEGTLCLGGPPLGDGVWHTLTTGAVFVYGPGIPHDMRCSPDRPMEKYFLTFAGAEAKKRLLASIPRPGEIVQSAAPEHVLRLFEDLIDAGRRETPYRARICRAIMEHLLLRIAESAVPLGTIGTDAFDTFQRCREWIEQGYRRIESLSEIAAHCGVDPAYICRLFRRYAHQSPWQYVLRLKMRDAAQRLQSQDVRVGQVAAEFGFNDPFQFSRTFRRVLGVSPRQFVQLQRRHP